MNFYWKTLRFVRKNRTEGWSSKSRSVKNRWWHKGTCAVCVLTTRCNLHCDYCPMFFKSDRYPKFDECTLGEWRKFFVNYPDWVSQIYISGGEPTKMPYLAELINWLIHRGHHVCLFTNLANPEILVWVKPSYRFMINATCHTSDNTNRFTAAYETMKYFGYNIQVVEMEEKRLEYSVFKGLFTRKYFKEDNHFYHFPPDAPRTGQVFLGCEKLYNYGNENRS